MWYSSGGYTPTRRVSISLDGNGASANYSVTIPSQLDDFWETVDASGAELRVTDADGVTVITYDLSGFSKADALHFDALLHGCIAQASQADQLISTRLDRPLSEISPIERVVLWIGVYEMQHCPDVPWRVVLNECVELAKEFGGTDGHKYVNAVLNGLAPELRALEVQADRAARHSA